MSSRKSVVFFGVYVTLLLAFFILWQLFFNEVSYYVPCAVLIVFSMLLMFFKFEKRKSSAREITLTASLVAIAVASRAVFYLIPQVKPIAAVVIISAVCLGAERGFIVGALSAFVSNFIFGQGPWTPFQMLALGAVGLISGLLLKKKHSRVSLSLVGFALSFALYGLIVDLSTVLMTYGSNITLHGMLSVYAAGAPFSAVFGVTTAVFLFLFGEPFISKISRVIKKYNIIENNGV
ncbi:MAG: ECF transporter S component [Eubacterium sp.]|nr:ECF transporter S component [Eubacterium sp.]